MSGFRGIPGFHDVEVELAASSVLGYRSFTLGTGETLAAADVPPALWGPAPGAVAKRGPDLRARHSGALYGLHCHDFRWGNGTNVATCLRRNFGVAFLVNFGGDQQALKAAEVHRRESHRRSVLPDDCGCGFWAYTTDPVRTLMVREWTLRGQVVGVIEGWGTVVAGPKGFRTQYAKIRALAPGPLTPCINDKQRSALERARTVCYRGVPWFDSFVDMVAAFPPSDLTPYLPEDDESEDEPAEEST